VSTTGLSHPTQDYRWPVAVSRIISAPATALWRAISAPGNLELCHPFCRANPVATWPGVGSRDQVHYLNGVVYERRFRRWIEGTGYDLDIGPAGGKLSTVSWRITPVDETTSTLGIVVYPHLVQGVPVVLRWLPHLLWVRPRLEAYLTSVIRGFEWYLQNDEPVPRNQFGRHPWFSAG